METSSGSSNLLGIKTAVFYRWNAYLPENAVDLDVSYDTFLEDYSSEDVFYLSDDSESDYLSFSEYGFLVNPEKTKYKSFVKTNLFDTETLELTKNESSGEFDYDKLRWLTNSIFPQCTSDLAYDYKKFFGMVSNGGVNMVFLDIPGEERDPETSNIVKPGVWKVELYSDILSSNNPGGKFIEYSVLEALGFEDEAISPCLTITFGPPSNASQNMDNEDLWYYVPNDLFGSIPEYPDAAERKAIPGWINLCREISSRKLLYVLVTPSGELESVNLSYMSWERSINPNRNQNEYSLRNDEFKVSRETITPFIHDKNDNYLYDSNSGVLLATEKLNPGNRPSFDRRFRRMASKFNKRRVYNEMDVVPVNDSLYFSLINGNLGEDPRYSKYWMKLSDYASKDKELLENIDLSKSKVRDFLTPNYTTYCIWCNKKDLFANLNWKGEVEVRTGETKELTIETIPGYSLSKIKVDGEEVSNTDGDIQIEYDKESHKFTYYLSPTDEQKGRTINIYLEAEKVTPYIDISEVILGGMDDNISSMADFTEKYDITFEVYYGTEDGEAIEEIKESEESSRRFYLDQLEYPVYIKINDEKSMFQCNSLEGSLEKIETESPFDHVYKVVDPSEVLNSKELTIVVQYKQLVVIVMSDQDIDISNNGGYVTWNGNFTVEFAVAQKEIYTFDEIVLNYEGGLVVSSSSSNFQEYASLGYSRGIYSLTLKNITKNCKIEIKSIEKR